MTDEVLEISVALARVNGLDPDQASRFGFVVLLGGFKPALDFTRARIEPPTRLR